MAKAKKRAPARRKAASTAPAPAPLAHVAESAPHYAVGKLTTTQVLWVAGAITTILGAIIAWDKALPIIEPWWYGSRGYVRDYTTETTTKKLEPIAERLKDYEGFRIEQTIEMAKVNLNQLTGQLDLAKKELELYPNSNAARSAVERLTKDVADTRRRIEEYNSALLTRRVTK